MGLEAEWSVGRADCNRAGQHQYGSYDAQHDDQGPSKSVCCCGCMAASSQTMRLGVPMFFIADFL